MERMCTLCEAEKALIMRGGVRKRSVMLPEYDPKTNRPTGRILSIPESVYNKIIELTEKPVDEPAEVP